MWREYIQNLSDDYAFYEPADEKALIKAESSLGLTLPTALRELLKETNGLHERSAYLEFIFPIARIEEDNLSMRKSPDINFYMPFDHLLFFADAGNGDKFGFPNISRRHMRTESFYMES